MSPVTVGSLCTGYGGLEMALGLLFGEDHLDVRWHAETDPDASAVLKRWWDVPNLGDITTAGFWETAEPTDIQVGGIPCQPFSQAGRHHGTADDRYLWPHWLEGIMRTRPKIIIFENVGNLVLGKMRTVFEGDILTSLVDLGYHVRWCVLGACAIGAAHHRHRVFLYAALSSDPGVQQVDVGTCSNAAPGTLLPTPSARDGGARGTGGDAVRRQALGKGGNPGVYKQMDLPTMLQLIPGPGVEPRHWGQYAPAVALHAVTLGREAPEPIEYGPRGGRRLAASFSEWLMMLPAGHLTSVLDRKPALTRAGNGVVPLQAATAITLLMLGDVLGDEAW